MLLVSNRGEPSKHSIWWIRLWRRHLSSSSEDDFKTTSDQEQYVRRGYTSSEDIFKTSLGCLLPRRIYSSHIFKDFVIYLQDFFKTFSRHLARMSSRHLQDVFQAYSRDINLNCSCLHVFNTSSRRIQHIFERFCADDYLQKDLYRSHFWEIYGQGTHLPIVNSLEITKFVKKFS